MKIKHALIPWQSEIRRDMDSISIYADDGKEGDIAEVVLKSRGGVYDDRTDAEQEANADFILKAVNNHQHLINALTAMTEFVREQLDDDAIDLDCFPGLIDSVNDAEETLAKLKK